VVVASIHNQRQITCARKTVIVAGKLYGNLFIHLTLRISDKLLSEVEQTTFDAIALPGGMPGATNLSESLPLLVCVGEK
jgi:enhancing lycopene biosynthesis protein 2